MAYYRTVVQIEILSKDPYEYTNLRNLEYDVTQGDCSGVTKVISSEEVDRESMANLLLSQGSDPSFLIDDLEEDVAPEW